METVWRRVAVFKRLSGHPRERGPAEREDGHHAEGGEAEGGENVGDGKDRQQ